MTQTVPESARSNIQQGYSTLLEQQGFKARIGQRQMIAEIARNLSNSDSENVSLIEAGTGVGKSVGYLIPSLIIAREKDKKLVVSTATAALQDQLVNQDLPNLRKAMDRQFSFGLVKGRKRYLCQFNLDKCLHGGTSGMALVDYFEGGQSVSKEGLKLYASLESARNSNQWDGDRDHWPEAVAESDWNLITSDRHSCMAARCSFFSKCSFYEARDAVDSLDLLVVNHDLLLADLMLGGGVILPAPEDCIYVLDEAHHLTDKTREHLSTRLNTAGATASLSETIVALAKMSQSLASVTNNGAISSLILDLRTQIELFLTEVDGIENGAATVAPPQSENALRFEQGKVPEPLLAAVLSAQPVAKKICILLDQLNSELEKLADSDQSEIKSWALSWYSLTGEWLSRAQSWAELLNRYATTDSNESFFARWIRRFSRTGGYELNAAPIDVGTQLRELLWNRAAAAVLTSATLSVRGNFGILISQLGLARDTPSASIQSPFDYANNAILELCPNAPDPRSEREYEEYIREFLETGIDPDKATLVLFSSNKQMEQVFAAFDGAWKQQILVQGLMPRMEIIRQHKSRVDAKQGSIIFGLRSFAEGIDLPGDYCTHLIITRIPFAVPDDPIEATISEQISAGGGNSFRELSLPYAAIRLTQAVGRLIRSETDKGTVTILDSRLLKGSYSRYLLSALPPFRLVERD